MSIKSSLQYNEKIMLKIKHSPAALIPAVLLGALWMIPGIFVIVFDFEDLITSYEPTTPEVLLTAVNVISFIIGILMIFVTVYILLNCIYELLFAKLVLTNKRILGYRGLIAKYNVDILLEKVDMMSVINGFLGRLLHYGTIAVMSPSLAYQSFGRRTAMNFLYVSNAFEFKKAVVEAIDVAKDDLMREQVAAFGEIIKNN